MVAGLRALLSGVIDYAGLFPPASLSLDQSIRNYAKYFRGDDRWMLGRFICPAALLSELLPYLDELYGEQDPLPLSVLGRGGVGDAYKADFVQMAEFRTAAAGRATIGGFETKIDASGSYELPGASRDVYLEFPWDRIDLGAGVKIMGLKLRTGGTDSVAFPSVEIVAHAIAKCRDAGKHMKFTAGLHHPIRHYNESVKTRMHGFINVFVAGVLAGARGLDEGRIIAILSDESAASFTFDDDGLRWQDHRASIAQIESARRDRVISFGSCSFDEPREDLRALGWM
ncbi:MAG: hypothetical protein ACREJC_07540 [Tepidisphaeraceae bacterium]